jgi:hypothetical protein
MLEHRHVQFPESDTAVSDMAPSCACLKRTISRGERAAASPIKAQRIQKAEPSCLAVNATRGGRRGLAMEVRQISEAREAPPRFLVAICRSAPSPRQKL